MGKSAALTHKKTHKNEKMVRKIDETMKLRGGNRPKQSARPGEVAMPRARIKQTNRRSTRVGSLPRLPAVVPGYRSRRWCFTCRMTVVFLAGDKAVYGCWQCHQSYRTSQWDGYVTTRASSHRRPGASERRQAVSGCWQCHRSDRTSQWDGSVARAHRHRRS